MDAKLKPLDQPWSKSPMSNPGTIGMLSTLKFGFGIGPNGESAATYGVANPGLLDVHQSALPLSYSRPPVSPSMLVSGGVSPNPPSPAQMAPPPSPIPAQSYNPAARDIALRQLATQSPAAAPAPAASPEAPASAAGQPAYDQEWDRLQTASSRRNGDQRDY